KESRALLAQLPGDELAHRGEYAGDLLLAQTRRLAQALVNLRLRGVLGRRLRSGGLGGGFLGHGTILPPVQSRSLHRRTRRPPPPVRPRTEVPALRIRRPTGKAPGKIVAFSSGRPFGPIPGSDAGPRPIPQATRDRPRDLAGPVPRMLPRPAPLTCA